MAAARVLPPERVERPHEEAGIGFAQLLSRAEVLRMLAVAFTAFFVFSATFNYLPFYLSAPPIRAPIRVVTLLYLAYIVGMIAGPLAIRFFFPRYSEGTGLLVPFALASLFAGLFQPYNTFLASHGRGAEVRNIAIAVAAASLFSLSLVVPRYGISGAAWTAAAVMALDYVLHLYYYQKFKRTLTQKS